MRKIKKFAALLLALVMAAALAAPALAEETKGTITISNAIDGKEYSIYRIFDLESYASDSAYSYKVNDEWADFFAKDAEGVDAKGLEYVDINEGGYVTWKDGASATEFAAAAIAYATGKTDAKGNKIEIEDGSDPVPNVAAVASKTASKDEELKFTDLELGYYLVGASADALCSLSTTDPDAKIYEKNDKPSLDKEVKEVTDAETGEGTWGDSNDVNIGTIVEFRATITVPENREFVTDYVMHDKMSAGLKFKEVTKILLNDDESNVVDKDNYTVETSTSDECTFEVKFENDWLKGVKADSDAEEDEDSAADKKWVVPSGSTIVVYYTAELTTDAVVGSGGNTNDARLEYGDEEFTEWDETTTYTYSFDLVKTNGEDVLLPGAVFALYREEETVDDKGDLHMYSPNSQITFAGTRKETDEQGREDNWMIYTVGTGTTNQITVENGKIIIEGLDAGTYYLEEITAPDGYNKLVEPVKVVIEATNPKDGNATVGSGSGVDASVTQQSTSATVNTDKEYKGGGVRITNYTGALLPSTGGIGTTIFYIVGGVLAVGAVVLLITKRRVGSAGEE